MNKPLYIFAASMAMLSLSSCGKNLENGDDPEAPSNGESDGLFFTASMESCSDVTEIVAHWESTDEICVNGVKYLASPDGDKPTVATFTKEGEGEAPTGPYEAYFPASIYDGLPSTYTYTAGKYYMPMYAESKNERLDFKALCAMLAIKVTSSDISSLKTIKVKSDKAMCGSFLISENIAELGNPYDQSKTVVLTCPEALTLDANGTTFYIPIPVQEYSYLEIYLSSDGTTYTEMMCTKNASGLGILPRNTVYYIDYEVNAIQLWDKGPFWATTNIGASSSTEAGQYFAWGYADGQTADIAGKKASYFTGTFDNAFSKAFNGSNYPNKDMETLDYYNDMAVANWGTDWSMPTKTDLSNLLSAYFTSVECVETGTKGIRVKGRDKYAKNSIFLPIAGYGDGTGLKVGSSSSTSLTDGFYWSGEASDYNKAYILTFSAVYGVSEVMDAVKYRGCSVRPVRSYKYLY